MKTSYTGPQQVLNVIGSLGRTEDIKFSPSNRRLAVAGYIRNRITVFDICIAASVTGPSITLPKVVEIASAHINYPHGLDFIDDETIIVANREGSALIFKVPQAEIHSKCYELAPVGVISSVDLVNTPGSISVCIIDKYVYQALICNNYANNVTKHIIDFGACVTVKNSEVLIEKWLGIPDGISISRDMQWIAVSNHRTHCVLLYANTPSLSEISDPDGILGLVYCPHGLRFTSDGRFILVADAGAPYVHIYGRNGSSWRGVSKPLRSVRVLDDEDYLRGRHGPGDGGPKGLDIHNATNMLVTTCEIQPLNFVDWSTILQSVQCAEIKDVDILGGKLDDSNSKIDDYRNQRAYEVRYELDKWEREEARIAALINSRSWRMTAPLRRLSSFLKYPH
jgi:DNA-binding beta-propeller fold protein YncE